MPEDPRAGATAALIEAPTFAAALRRAVELHPAQVAVRTVDDSIALTYRDFLARAESLARGLAGLGLGRGDTLATMLTNRPEFLLVDAAAVLLGAVPFSIYQTLTPAQIAYVVADSGAASPWSSGRSSSPSSRRARASPPSSA
jgi:long-chain acyl-CoA synthetase